MATPDEGFLRRWSRLKARGDDAVAPAPDALRAAAQPELAPLAQTTPHPPVAPLAPAPGAPGVAAPAGAATPARPLPTLEDVARLDADSDFSAFVTQGVDKAVQRLAMKKLFSDPHFNLMDGLDIYIDDYNAASPVSAAMLAALQHARRVFAPHAQDEPGAPGDDAPPPPGLPDGDHPQSSQGDA